MTTTKVCVWNVQNYGSGAKTSMALKWGADSRLRNRFIADFVTSAGIDVLFIVEMAKDGQASLRALAAELNGRQEAADDKDWAVSYCGAAITKRSPDPPQTSADVQFLSGARSEGYAVVWRTNRVGRFSVLNGLYSIAKDTYCPPENRNPPARTPLNLVTKGRLAENVQVDILVRRGAKRMMSTATRYDARGGFTPDGTLPYVGQDRLPWAALSFPTVGGKAAHQLEMFGTRRPAYVVLRLAGAGGDKERLCPVAAYHAPSATGQASWGAFKAGLSRELYVTNRTNPLAPLDPAPADLVAQDRTVMGGDFNYRVAQGDWATSWYTYFTNPFGSAADAGAACEVAPPEQGVADEARKTTVQIMKGPRNAKEPIPPGPMGDFLSLEIDLAFFRGASGERVNLPQALLDDDARTFTDTLKQLRAHLQEGIYVGWPAMVVDPARGPGTRVRRNKAWVWQPKITGSWGGTFTDWPRFMEQLRAGRFTEPRAAAEFFHMFVSDHLPLVVTIDH